MKLLYITDGHFGSNEANMVQAHNTVSALAAIDSVSTIAFVGSRLKSQADLKSEDLYNEHEQLTGNRVSSKVSFHCVETNPSSWFKTLKSAIDGFKDLDYQSYDLIYTRSRIALISFYLLGFKRFCYEPHSLETPSSLYKKLLYRRAIKYAPKLITPINNRLLQDFIYQFRIHPNRLKLIPCSARAVNQTLKPITQRPYIAFCGSSYPGKGLDEVLEAAKKLPELQFLVITRFTDRVNTLKSSLSSNVTLHLDLPNNKVYELLKDAKIALAPYQANAQTSGGWSNTPYLSPLKVFEYLAFKCLVLTSDIPAMREIITHRENGLLFKNNDLNELIHTISEACELIDNGKGESIANAGEALFKAKYSYQVRAKQILELQDVID